MISPEKYLPSVAWRTLVTNVVMLDDFNYRINYHAVDANEPGAYPLIMGDYLKDNVGHTYKIVDYTSNTLDIEDTFKIGVGPQTGQYGIVYKSVFKGLSPYLAPIYYRHLDKVALEYSRQFELDILWRNDPNAIKIEFSDTNTPKIENYQDDYAEDYGELPKVQLVTYDSEGVEWVRQEVPIWYRTDGKLTSIEYDLSDNYSGYIILSK